MILQRVLIVFIVVLFPNQIAFGKTRLTYSDTGVGARRLQVQLDGVRRQREHFRTKILHRVQHERGVGGQLFGQQRIGHHDHLHAGRDRGGNPVGRVLEHQTLEQRERSCRRNREKYSLFEDIRNENARTLERSAKITNVNW